LLRSIACLNKFSYYFILLVPFARGRQQPCQWVGEQRRVVLQLGPAHGLRGQGGGYADHSFFIAWPPNSLRIAESNLSENESALRERRRSISDAVMMGAGTSRSMASA